jgi:hypothetical protein
LINLSDSLKSLILFLWITQGFQPCPLISIHDLPLNLEGVQQDSDLFTAFTIILEYHKGNYRSIIYPESNL